MSIEAKHNAGHDNSTPESRAQDTVLQSPQTVETPTADQVRQQVHEDHQPSILERLDTPAKKFGAGVLVFTTLIGGGLATQEVLKATTQPQQSGTLKPDANETSVPTTSTEPSPHASPANTTALETAKPVETAPSLELSVEKYADKEALAKAIVEDRMSAWYMEGTTEENQESYYTRPEPWAYSEYVASAEKESVPYIKALFTDDWSAHPETVEFIQRAKDMNAQSMSLNLATSKFSGDPQNIEPYAVKLDVTTVEEAVSENGNRLLIIDFKTNDNTDLNTAEDAMTKSIDNTVGSWKLELKQEGGVYKIASAKL